jgi:hypothetical protein
MKSINADCIQKSRIRYLCCRHLSAHSSRVIRCGHIRKWVYVTEVSTLKVRVNKRVYEAGQCHTTLGEAFLISFAFYQPARDSVPRIYRSNSLYGSFTSEPFSVQEYSVQQQRKWLLLRYVYISTKLLNMM